MSSGDMAALLWTRTKKLVPRRVKGAVKAALLAHRFERALRALLRLPAGEIPSSALLEELAIG